MTSALIVSRTEKSVAFFTQMLSAASIGQVVTSPLCAAARRLLLERDFDLVVVNAPLPDETGEGFARHVAFNGVSQVILVVKNEHFEAVSAVCGPDGVLTVSRPLNGQLFWHVLMLARSTHAKMSQMRAASPPIKQKIDDIRVVDRAKCLLISYLSMTEQEAHRFIEKQAMDMRATKRLIAEGIIKTYEE